MSSKLKKKPSPITELQSILGLVGYFRRSIPNFGQTASPLYQILTDSQNKQRHSKESIDSNDNHQAALDKLLHHLVTPPILAYPDYDQPFILHKDASRLGLGCSLFQMQKGKLRVLGFGSHTLVGAEKKYHSSKLEFLALKWVVCEHFRDYLFYVPRFDVYTDYNSLTYIKSLCKVNATGQRRINELTDFNFTVHYKPDVENAVADTASRLPINDVEDLQAFSGLCSVDEVKAIFDGAVNQAQNGEAWLPKVNIINTDLETELLYTGGRSRESLTNN